MIAWVFVTMLVYQQTTQAADPVATDDVADHREAPSDQAADPAVEPAPDTEPHVEPGTKKKPAWPFVKRAIDLEPIQTWRDNLADNGIEFRYRLTMTFQSLVSGGVDTEEATAFTGRGDFDLKLATEKLNLWPGGQFRTRFRHGWEDNLFAKGVVGSRFDVLFPAPGDEVAMEHYLYEHRFKLTDDITLVGALGKINTRDYFDMNALTSSHREQFSNRAFVDTQNFRARNTGTIGAVISIEHPFMYVRSGVFDAQGSYLHTGFDTAFDGDDEANSINEIGFTPKLPGPNGDLAGTYRVGLWFSGTTVRVLDYDSFGGRLPPKQEAGDNGIYLSFDQQLYKEVAQPEDNQGLAAFFKYGRSEPNQATVKNFYAAGLTYTGLIPTRDHDALGMGWAMGELQSALPDTLSTENVFETFYRIEVFPWLKLTPGVQFIFNPGGTGNTDDAVVLTLKTLITF